MNHLGIPGDRKKLFFSASQKARMWDRWEVDYDDTRTLKPTATQSGGRQYLPKGLDLSGISQPRLNAIARRLNERPRKTSGYETPADRYR